MVTKETGGNGVDVTEIHGYKIEDSDLSLTIALVPVKDLIVHEEIIGSDLDKLMLQIRNWGVIRNPIIVDSNHLIILDGNHRAAAFRELNYAYIPACIIPYDHPRILLKNWYRRILSAGKFNFAQIQKSLVSHNLSLESLRDFDTVLSRISTVPGDTSRIVCGLTDGDTTNYLVSSSKPLDIVQRYDVIQAIERSAEGFGFTVEYIPDEKVRDYTGSLFRGIILLTPPLEKELVTRYCLEGKIFARKTTRHVIPARPLNIDVPLDWLKSSVSSLSALNEKLHDHLEAKRMQELPPGQVFDGRMYSEKLYIFTDRV